MDNLGYVDLHTHTKISDGTKSPEEVVALAKKTGLCAVAITDHDTVAGVEEAVCAGKKHDITVVPGVELAAHYLSGGKKTEIHIVGLFINYKDENLVKQLDIYKTEREERNKKMVEKLRGLGMDITVEELLNISGGKVITRAHYAALMEKKGYIKNKNEAFEKYISPGLKGYVARVLPPPKTCIELILSAGGIPILAHPSLYGMNYNQIRIMLTELKSFGLKGIEVMYSSYNHEQEREFKRISKEFNLLPSGGSDYHGDNKPGIYIGIGKGNLKIPYEFYENLKNSL